MSDPFDVEPGDDLSAFDDAPPAPMSIGGDTETIKAINKRTSLATKAITGLIVIGAIGGGYYGYTRSVAWDVREEPLNACGEIAPGEELNQCLRQVLENAEFEDVKQSALRNLGHFRDAGAVELITRQLDEAGVVRRSAAWALARIGLPAAESSKSKLLEVLPLTTDVDRSQVVWTLAVLQSQDQAALDAIVDQFATGRLQTLDGFEPRVITNALGVERLSSVELTDHDQEPVRRLTAHALAEDGSAAVIAPLARMLQNEIQRTGDDRSTEVIRATAAGLGRTGDASAARPLFAALGSEPTLQDTILDSLERSTAATDLAVLLPEASSVDVKRAIVGLLAKSHDRRIAETLQGLLSDEDRDIKAMAALALADFGDASAKEALYELSAVEDNDDLVSDVIEHLRCVVDESDVDRLAAMIETHPYRRAAILRALGATGADAAVRPLEAQLDGDDMRAATLSLGDLNTDVGFRIVMGMLGRNGVEMAAANAADRSLVNEEVLAKRRAAVMAVGRFGRTQAIDDLMTIVEDDQDDYELRSLAAAAIGQVADAEGMGAVLTKVAGQGLSDDAKRYYVQALWQRPHRELNAQLLGLMTGTSEPEIKRAAALALGYAADPANDDRLISMLDDEATQRNAAFAILLGGGDAAVQRLIAVLGESADLREVLQQTVMNTENDWFNLLTEEMFESGAIWRRLHAAALLRDGDGERTYSYPWLKVAAVLRTGWEGVGGMRPMMIRDKLWEAMSGEDDERRQLATELLFELPEVALLLRARDEGGAMEEAARRVLNRQQAE